MRRSFPTYVNRVNGKTSQHCSGRRATKNLPLFVRGQRATSPAFLSTVGLAETKQINGTNPFMMHANFVMHGVFQSSGEFEIALGWAEAEHKEMSDVRCLHWSKHEG
jgi:hypothetical protein